jgi:PKD repeat protein
VKVTVNNVQGGTIISDQTICSGSDPISFMSIVNGSGDGVFTFQWQSSTDGVSYADISGATALTYDPPVLTQDTWYKRITSSVLNGVECSQESNIVKVTVNTVTGGIIDASQTICYGSTPVSFTSTDDGTGTGAVTYQWQRSSDNITFVNIPGANSTGYTPGALIADTWYRRVIISTLSGIVCSAESNVIKVTVNPLPVAILSGGETICPGDPAVLRVTMMAGTGPFEVEIENHGTVSGYTSGDDITVTPAVTTTYKLLRVTDANGCEVTDPSANMTGTATVVVSTTPSITDFTPSGPVCEFTTATFTVTADGTSPTYQWYVDEGSGFNAISDGGIYFGVTTPTLQIFNSVREMDGYVYHVVVSGCGTDVTSADAVFTVNTAPEITLHPSDTTVCLGDDAAMEADATGSSVTWQWYVNKGSGFVAVTDDTHFSGSATAILTITDAEASYNNWVFRAEATGICGVPVYTNFGRLSVINPPSVTLHPVDEAICEDETISFLGNGTGYTGLQWQVYTGSGWTDITDDAIYVGSATNQLSVINAPVTLDGTQYRLGLEGECMTVYTDDITLTVHANPVVDFSGIDPIAACGGVSVVIDGNPAGGSGTYTQHRWTGDVGPLSNYLVQAPSFNSQISGDYNLIYRVTDSNGCTAEDDLTVTVDSPSALFSQDVNNGCTPLTVTFSKDMTGVDKYWWDFNDGSPLDSVNANPVHIFENANASSIEYYDVELTVQSPGGCLDTFTSMITVYPAVDASFTASEEIVCSGSTVEFTAVSGASKYYWEYGDGATGYGTNISTHVFTNFTTSPIVHTVRLTTTSFYNCTDERTLDITVVPVPIVQFNANPPSQVYDPDGNTVTFTNETNEGTWSWLWRFDDGNTSSEKDPVHTYTELGDYNVTLIASNAYCSDSISHVVSVLPEAPVADFDSIMSDCEPLYIEINNTSLNTDVPGTTYRWDFGDGSISTAKNPTYTYFDAGSYRIELTVTGPGGTSVKSQVVNAYASPKAYFEVSPTYVFVNDEKVRCFNLSQGADSYLWEFGDGDTSHVVEPFHKYMESGVFDITLWAYSDNGCSDRYLLSPGVTVEPPGELRFSTVFTPNLDGPIDIDYLPSGGTEIDQFFFPPIREKVIDYKLQIFNRLGVLIFESHDINKPWNGYYKGELCQQGVYIWYVEGKYANGMPFKKVGDVTLLH